MAEQFQEKLTPEQAGRAVELAARLQASSVDYVDRNELIAAAEEAGISAQHMHAALAPPPVASEPLLFWAVCGLWLAAPWYLFLGHTSSPATMAYWWSTLFLVPIALGVTTKRAWVPPLVQFAAGVNVLYAMHLLLQGPAVMGIEVVLMSALPVSFAFFTWCVARWSRATRRNTPRPPRT